MAQLSGGGMDDVFARESKRRSRAAEQKEEARRKKACESKNRYASKFDAEVAINACADYGSTGLSAYKCPYCNGWHLTSHPWTD